jgi:hypothetical protein
MPGTIGQLEIRPVYEAEDFGDNLTPDLRAQNERLRERLSTPANKKQ